MGSDDKVELLVKWHGIKAVFNVTNPEQSFFKMLCKILGGIIYE